MVVHVMQILVNDDLAQVACFTTLLHPFNGLFSRTTW